MEKRDVGIAYLLFIVAGAFGAHRFYIGRKGSGAGLAALTLAVLPVTALSLLAGGAEGLLFGAVAALALGVWLTVDLFTLAGMTARYNDGVRLAQSHPLYMPHQPKVEVGGIDSEAWERNTREYAANGRHRRG